ncbi:vacuolar import/degradation protein Vid24 [Chaetomium sp. MPI-CAGE-AT-0009]|nr:vacuolar import/degradation protein Vid24 [Chaetomium sp. MPI-CAGE-AT-0009]
MRIIPSPPLSFLRHGSQFEGVQQSGQQRYNVNVEIIHVDLQQSFLCGDLRIQGLIWMNEPSLIMYFEGEIVGTKYSFTTQHIS